jgi:hypothetical protein
VRAKIRGLVELLIDWFFFFWGGGDVVYKKLSYGIEKIPGLGPLIDVRTLPSYPVSFGGRIDHVCRLSWTTSPSSYSKCSNPILSH